MSFVLSGPAWWRQLKQTHNQSGAGVIKCHMWMNKGATLKPFVVFVNVFHLSLKRLNDFVVSWCMWLVALPNEGNSYHWYTSLYSQEFLAFDLGAYVYLKKKTLHFPYIIQTQAYRIMFHFFSLWHERRKHQIF